MRLSWSFRRKLLYTSVATVVGVVVLWFMYNTLIARAPTCFDGTWNADERDIDCGGSCALICAQDARAPVVIWTRAFRSSDTTYTIAAYVENRNGSAGARDVQYSFQLFDDKNLLIVERLGSTDLPPVENTPVLEANIEVGTRNVARALFAFTETPRWERNQKALPQLRTTKQFISADASRLSATIVNDGIEDVRNTKVVAVLFDTSGIARAASQTTLSRISKRSSQDIAFTWAGGVDGVVRAEITVLPAF